MVPLLCFIEEQMRRFSFSTYVICISSKQSTVFHMIVLSAWIVISHKPVMGLGSYLGLAHEEANSMHMSNFSDLYL